MKVSSIQNTTSKIKVLVIHYSILSIVEGICGHKLADGHCDDNALCRVGVTGRTLEDCYCRDGFIGNGFICRGMNSTIPIIDKI